MKIFLSPLRKIAPLIILLLPLVVSAGTATTDGFGKLDQGFEGTVDAATPLAQAVRNIVNVLLTLAGIIAATMIVYGGVKYMTSAGDENQAEEGKKTVIYALIGLLVIGLAVVLVNFTIGAIGNSSGN